MTDKATDKAAGIHVEDRSYLSAGEKPNLIFDRILAMHTPLVNQQVPLASLGKGA